MAVYSCGRLLTQILEIRMMSEYFSHQSFGTVRDRLPVAMSSLPLFKLIAWVAVNARQFFALCACLSGPKRKDACHGTTRILCGASAQSRVAARERERDERDAIRRHVAAVKRTEQAKKDWERAQTQLAKAVRC